MSRKSFVWVAFVLFLSFGVSQLNGQLGELLGEAALAKSGAVVGPENEEKEEAKSVMKAYWTCPMHPQVHEDRAGDCPICHMKLVEVKPQKPGEQANHESHDEHQAHAEPGKTQAKMQEGAPKGGVDYWTCPMHPQVRSEHAGECPICHMKLVEEKSQRSGLGGRAKSEAAEEDEKRAAVVISDSQLKSLGVQKTLVEKMDLTVHIPIAGRFISPTTVAFQVYETDLRYVKPGLAFTGESGFKPEAPLRGTISSVDSIVDPTSRTVRVVGAIRSGPSGIIAETTFRGDLAISLKGVVSIPESSVLHSGKQDLVYKIHTDGMLRAHAIKLGLKTESYYEVIEGLKPGEYISSGPNFLIDSEAKIRGAAGSGHTHH